MNYDHVTEVISGQVEKPTQLAILCLNLICFVGSKCDEIGNNDIILF